MATVFPGIMLPFLGTLLGAGCVFFFRNPLRNRVQQALTGFAAGVMVAASVWSLILPALKQLPEPGGVFSAAGGFWCGILFLLALDRIIPHLHRYSVQPEGLPAGLGRSTMLMLAVTLHNLPEGMAVGAVYGGLLAEGSDMTATGALTLALGIAIQNFPEGAIISMPLKSEGMNRGRAFLFGALSGIVEPLGAIITILASRLILPLLPCFLCFAAGAMVYVVVEELIPEMSAGRHSNVGTVFFAVGFTLMMVLDVALG